MNKFHKFGFSHSARTKAAAMGAMKLAQMAKMSEEEFESFLKKIEDNRFFKLLKASGAVSLAEFPNARYAAKKYAGYGLKMSAGGLPELADGACDLVGLIQGIGQKKFEACFLKDAVMSDVERAEECEIAVKDAARLRDFVNRAFIQAEFESAPEAPASKVFSAVAGIELENGKPVLAFFHREIWKGRYKVDGEKLSEALKGLPASEQTAVEKLVRRMELADKRKSTLYRALEIVMERQADYLLTGEPVRRSPLPQKVLAAELEVHPSVLNRLISNKSIELPWGTEAPVSVLLPSSKAINLERLYAIAVENPELTDTELCAELKIRHGVELSRQSIVQYRKDLSLSRNTSNNP